MRVLVFAGDWACEIELRQTGVICFPWRQRSWSCGVFKSWISDAHCPFQWKWQVLHNYDISMLQQVGVFFDGIACLMKVWPLFKREFPRVPMTCTREFQMWRRRCKQIDPHWFQGRQMRFWWMLSTMSWKYFMIYKVRLFSTANLTRAFLDPIFNSYWPLLQSVNHRQQPVTSRLALTCCGSVSTVFSRKIYFLCIDQNLF